MDDAGRVRSHDESAEGRLAALADVQFGVLSRRQALDAGLSERQIQLRLSAKRWESRLRGVYRIIGAPDTAQQSAMACALYAGEGALVSHGTAGVLWRLANVRANDVELWVPSAKTSDVHGLTIHRGKRLDRADRTKLGPMRSKMPRDSLSA